MARRRGRRARGVGWGRAAGTSEPEGGRVALLGSSARFSRFAAAVFVCAGVAVVVPACFNFERGRTFPPLPAQSPRSRAAMRLGGALRAGAAAGVGGGVGAFGALSSLPEHDMPPRLPGAMASAPHPCRKVSTRARRSPDGRACPCLGLPSSIQSVIMLLCLSSWSIRARAFRPSLRLVRSAITGTASQVFVFPPCLQGGATVLSPEHFIHLPRLFFQDNYDTSAILAGGLRVQVGARVGVQAP